MSEDTSNSRPADQPPEQQDKRPGHQSEMQQKPISEKEAHTGSGKLAGRVALITGGDSGIGRAVAIAYAKEGADIVISYLEESEDAAETKKLVEEKGGQCICIAGDIGNEKNCIQLVDQVVEHFGKLHILVNNAAEQHPQNTIADITSDQLERTFRTNLFSMFYLVKAALPHLSQGGAIINTTSVTAYRGSKELLDYSSTKGAIVSFTRSLSKSLVEQGIRVNGVAPGPIWTPLIPSTFPADKVESFGEQVPMQRAGQPEEVALSYVFLASDDSSYMTGQVLHPNGGEVING